MELALRSIAQDLEDRGIYVQAFADDVVLVFNGTTATEIEMPRPIMFKRGVT